CLARFVRGWAEVGSWHNADVPLVFGDLDALGVEFLTAVCPMSSIVSFPVHAPLLGRLRCHWRSGLAGGYRGHRAGQVVVGLSGRPERWRHVRLACVLAEYQVRSVVPAVSGQWASPAVTGGDGCHR